MASSFRRISLSTGPRGRSSTIRASEVRLVAQLQGDCQRSGERGALGGTDGQMASVNPLKQRVYRVLGFSMGNVVFVFGLPEK